jgi:RNA polymerase sigma factor (sigma-70 family)
MSDTASLQTPPGGTASIAVMCGLAEADSVAAIYIDHALLLRRVAIRKFNVLPADAEALVHDVFINYLVGRPSVSDLRAYLVAAICNACRNYWRSRRSEGRVFADDDCTAAADAVIAGDMIEGLELRLIIASILARLGSRCREVLRRYYLDGEQTASIATSLDTTPANVNYLMHVCRKRARDAYRAIRRTP